MANYINLNLNLTDAKNQAYAFISNLADIEGDSYRNSSYHKIDGNYDINTVMPVLVSSFASIGLTVAGVAHIAVNGDAMYIHATHGDIFIPLADFGSSIIKIYSVAPGAILQNNDDYLENDVSLIDQVDYSTLSDTIVVKPGLAYTIETSDFSKLADFLCISVIGGTDHLFT